MHSNSDFHGNMPMIAGGAALLMLAALLLCPANVAARPEPEGSRYAGVISKVYNEPDFTRIKRVLEPQDSLKAYFDAGVGHGRDWSGVWEGFLIAPVTGPLSLHVKAHKPTTLDMHERGAVTAPGTSDRVGTATLEVNVRAGEALPFRITYSHAEGGLGGWEVRWSHSGRPSEPVPARALFFDDRLANLYHWRPDPDPESIDFSKFATVDARHVIVAYEPGRTAAWPANYGFFTWGNEILQTYGKGHHLDRGLNHSIDPTRPVEPRQARSIDGGETWVEEPFQAQRPHGEPTFPPRDVDVDGWGFALRTSEGRVWYTQDRGRNWRGPYELPDLGLGAYTNRTDYIQLGGGSLLLGLSVEDPAIESQHNDRAFFVRADNDGRKPIFIGWLTPPGDLARAVMPSTIRVGDRHFLTAVRRKREERFVDRPPIARNWVEVFESHDDGGTWRSLGEVAETDTGRQNGNPPSLVHVKDGTIAIIYGYRAIPYSIRARVSHDLGRTWSREILLRRDSTTWDMGYTRSTVRPDGRIVSIYYLATTERPELHLEATIWDAGSVK